MTDRPQVRPMTAEDYAHEAVREVSAHPMRDLVLGAVVGAVALWAVPKLLDSTVGEWLGQRGEDPEEFDLELEP